MPRRVYKDGTVKPPTIEDIRNRIASARAHGDVAARDIINGQVNRTLEDIKNTVGYWTEAAELLELYLAVPNPNMAPTEPNETKG